MRVVVVSGQVALRPRGPARTPASPAGPGAPGAAPALPGVVLDPGQVGRLDAAGRVEVAAADTAAFLGWLSDRVVFRSAPLGEVAAELSRRFGVAVRVPDAALAARRVTLDVPARSLSELLDAAAVPLGARARRVAGGVVVLERRAP